jgi:hypothetical protein
MDGWLLVVTLVYVGILVVGIFALADTKDVDTRDE